MFFNGMIIPTNDTQAGFALQKNVYSFQVLVEIQALHSRCNPNPM